MSKNIVIQEDGLGKQLTTDKLKTNLVGGGTCLWVPEDETRLGTKYISADGTYKASDDGYYGYSEVTVNGVGSVTGKDPDTGEDVMVSKDPSTGEIVETVLPASISVVTPPARITYSDGSTIDFSGMVVKAYLKSGEPWTDSEHPDGVIPIGELTLPVTQASKDASQSDEWSDGHGINARLLSYTPHWNKYWDPIHKLPDPSKDYQVFITDVIGEMGGLPAMYGSSGGPTQFFATIYNGELYVWGSTADRKLNGYCDTGNEYDRYEMREGTSFSSGTGSMQRTSKDNWATGIPESTIQPTGIPQVEPVAAHQSIPVQWTRPGDGSTLETSFDITVT